MNVALAYGGRAELLDAARDVAHAIETEEVSAADVDISTVEDALYEGPSREVDLIVRTGGDERTSNFLPWQANGNEAAVYFCTPYWPEFRKVDFLRSIRTYEHREQSWRRSRAERARALISVGKAEYPDARETLRRFRSALPSGAGDEIETDGHSLDDSEPAD